MIDDEVKTLQDYIDDAEREENHAKNTGDKLDWLLAALAWDAAGNTDKMIECRKQALLCGG